MDNYELNEKLREACYLGDIELVKKLCCEQNLDVNSKNKVNGWTALHWASKRNNLKLVEFLMSIGALADSKNNDNKTPGEYTTDSTIASLLKITKVNEELFEKKDKKFVPNFVKNPIFHYSDKSFYSSDQKTTTMTENLKDSNLIDEKKTISSSKEITIKIRDSDEIDFIEIDLNIENISFENFKELILHEFDYDSEIKEIIKIRKLPNVLIRNTRDIKRLKENQEIEIIFKTINK